MLPRLTTTLLILSLLSTLAIGATLAEPANNGIWLQSANSGNQAWAYYPYDPGQPFTGGSYSPANAGTSSFTVTPGTTIYRKYIVINNEPYNDSVSYAITGLPSDWGLTYTNNNPNVISYVYNPTTGNGAQNSHQGFGSMVVSVPSSAAPGTYAYTIQATSGTGYTSSLTDSIVVGAAPVTPTPTPAPPATPTPTATPDPTIAPAKNATATPTLAPTPTPVPASASASAGTETATPVPYVLTIATPKPTDTIAAMPNDTITPKATTIYVSSPTTPGRSAAASPAPKNDTALWMAGIIAIALLGAAGYLFFIRK